MLKNPSIYFLVKGAMATLIGDKKVILAIVDVSNILFACCVRQLKKNILFLGGVDTSYTGGYIDLDLLEAISLCTLSNQNFLIDPKLSWICNQFKFHDQLHTYISKLPDVLNLSPLCLEEATIDALIKSTIKPAISYLLWKDAKIRSSYTNKIANSYFFQTYLYYYHTLFSADENDNKFTNNQLKIRSSAHAIQVIKEALEFLAINLEMNVSVRLEATLTAYLGVLHALPVISDSSDHEFARIIDSNSNLKQYVNDKIVPHSEFQAQQETRGWFWKRRWWRKSSKSATAESKVPSWQHRVFIVSAVGSFMFLIGGIGSRE
jgi:hypothetical protein